MCHPTSRGKRGRLPPCHVILILCRIVFLTEFMMTEAFPSEPSNVEFSEVLQSVDNDAVSYTVTVLLFLLMPQTLAI